MLGSVLSLHGGPAWAHNPHIQCFLGGVLTLGPTSTLVSVLEVPCGFECVNQGTFQAHPGDKSEVALDEDGFPHCNYVHKENLGAGQWPHSHAILTAVPSTRIRWFCVWILPLFPRPLHVFTSYRKFPSFISPMPKAHAGEKLA